MTIDHEALTQILAMLRADYHQSADWRQREIDIAIPQLTRIIENESNNTGSNRAAGEDDRC